VGNLRFIGLHRAGFRISNTAFSMGTPTQWRLSGPRCKAPFLAAQAMGPAELWKGPSRIVTTTRPHSSVTDRSAICLRQSVESGPGRSRLPNNHGIVHCRSGLGECWACRCLTHCSAIWPARVDREVSHCPALCELPGSRCPRPPPRHYKRVLHHRSR